MKKAVLAAVLGGALLADSAMAHQAGDVIFRAGAIGVIANSSSDYQTGADVNLDVNNNIQLGLTGTYMLSDNLGLELLAATPFSHKITGKLGATDLGEVAKVKHLPPSLYLQYYFFDSNATVRPYVGAGLNYTRFFSAESLKPQLVQNLRVKKHSVAPIANLGIDVKLTDNLSFNAAAWYTRIKTTADYDVPGLGHVSTPITLDPVVLFSGISYKF